MKNKLLASLFHNHYMDNRSKKKTKHPYLFQYKLLYRNETGTNHHGLLSTLT